MDELLSSTPELVLVGDEDISQAAKTGRVKRMYVPAFRRTTDSIRSEMSQAIVIQMSDDILELESAIRNVLAQSGEIQAVEIEPDSKVAKPKACDVDVVWVG